MLGLIVPMVSTSSLKSLGSREIIKELHEIGSLFKVWDRDCRGYSMFNSLGLLEGDLGLFPGPYICRLTIICNAGSRVFNTLFWSPQAPSHMRYTYIHSCMHLPYTSTHSHTPATTNIKVGNSSFCGTLWESST